MKKTNGYFQVDRNKLDLFEISHNYYEQIPTYLAYKTLDLSKEGKGFISMWTETKKNDFNDKLFPRKKRLRINQRLRDMKVKL